MAELVQGPDGQWHTVEPTECGNGHPYRPGHVTKSFVMCGCDGGSGHSVYHCEECGDVRYDPVCVRAEGRFRP
jgi:hypothetical protein